MKRDNIKTIMWIFCIIVLLTLSARLYYKSQELACDKCTVTFKDKTVTETEFGEGMEANVNKLFNAYHDDGRCLIYWDPVNGYGGYSE